MLRSILDWPQPAKRLTVLALDASLCLIATWLAFSLRLDTPHRPEGAQWYVYAITPLLALPIFYRFGLYRAIYRHTGMAAMLTTGLATTIYGLVLLLVLFALQRQGLEHMLPRSVGLLQPLLFLLMVVTSRAMARTWLRSLIGLREDRRRRRLLIYGAGEAGAQTAAGISSTGVFALLGFVDDDPGKAGRSINGVTVYRPADVPQLVHRLKVSDILLAMPSIARDRRNAIIESLRGLPVHVRTLPGLVDLANGRVTVQDIRELDIEDLLGRDTVAPDPVLLARNLRGKTVLVSGAGGSIGSELCRQIVRERPTRLVLVDHNEFGLYAVHDELLQLCEAQALPVALTPLLANVGNYPRMAAILRHYLPACVFHAAAYKHVPLVEANVAEGVHNNVFGTLHLARAAMENQTAHFVLVSTDKAVRPTSVMGASKRIAELVLQALAAEPAVAFAGAAEPTLNHTRFAMVRFGNVLGSSGSVVPAFRRQLAAGGPITVTHPEITRYFMTIPEAAQLVLQAGAMAEGGDVFVLEMGEPVRIMDLARRMVMLAGLTVRESGQPDGDIEIAISGLRPGEKLFEELLIGNNASPTAHARIMKAREDCVAWANLAGQLDQLGRACAAGADAQVRGLLAQLVPDFQTPVATPANPGAAAPAEAFC